MTRAAAWTVRSGCLPPALFVASASTRDDVTVVAAAGGVEGHGAIAVVVLFIPGSSISRFLVMPSVGGAS